MMPHQNSPKQTEALCRVEDEVDDGVVLEETVVALFKNNLLKKKIWMANGALSMIEEEVLFYTFLNIDLLCWLLWYK